MKRYLIIAAACALACASCRHQHTGHAHTEAADDAHDHGDEIVLSPERAAQAGVKVGIIQPGPFSAAVRTSGIVTTAQATVSAASSGILSWNGPVPAVGQKIAQGQTLAYVSGRNMAEGDAAEKAVIAYEKASKDYRRAQELHADNIISARELEAAQAEFALAEKVYRGLSDKSGAKGVALTAPVSGRIGGILRSEGDYVAAGEPVAMLTTSGSLRLQADLPEKYAALASTIGHAEYRLSYGGGLLRTGRLIAASGQMGAAPYLTLTFDLPDTDGVIPGSQAEVWLVTGIRENVISVPESALTEEQGAYFVYRQVDEEGYEKTRVIPGSRNGDAVEILSGLSGGERIVTEGAYQVKLAAASVIPGHSHEH